MVLAKAPSPLFLLLLGLLPHTPRKGFDECKSTLLALIRMLTLIPKDPIITGEQTRLRPFNARIKNANHYSGRAYEGKMRSPLGKLQGKGP